MSARLIRKAQAHHPGLRVRGCVRATSNPWWLGRASFGGFAFVSFVLRVIGFDFEQSLVFAFPGFVVTYLSVVQRFHVVGTDTDIHLMRRGFRGTVSTTDHGRVTIDEVEIIEESMIVDRWHLGDRELAILKRDRGALIDMIRHIAAEVSVRS